MFDTRRRAVRALSRWPRRSRGQSLVELALILPILMLILLGAIDFGRVLFSWIAVQNAAREAAALAIWNPTDLARIRERAAQESNIQAQRGEGAMSVTVTCRDSATQAAVPCSSLSVALLGSQVTVAVSQPFTFFTPLVGGLFPGFSLDASATGFHMSPVGGVAPGPTPTPTPTPTPPPGPTPTPTPTPTPALCTVPDFDRLRGRDTSVGLWTGAGFVAENLTYNVPGNSRVRGQSLGAGTTEACETATIILN